MPTPSHNSSAVYSQDLEDSSVDQQFKFALKNMLPVPSNSEQQIILDEYNLQLSQFSIAINRIIKETKSDENCVHLLKLMAGMYTLLKTTLLNPPVYRQLFQSIRVIENDAFHFISGWAPTAAPGRQVELFELGWWCEGALPRAYLVTLLFYSLRSLWTDPKYFADTFAVCKSIQHPLKGSFLYSRLHFFLKEIHKQSRDDEETRTLIIGYSVETFTTLLRLFCRWHQSLPAKTTETSYVASLYRESFEGFFAELASDGMCSYDMFETVVLPTILTEAVNSADLLAQSLIFTSLVQEFDGKYLLAQLGQLIKSSSQFAQGIDLKMLLSQLFTKVQDVNNGNDENFFETIWQETSKLIKNRCEIDQSDTVIISSTILSLIAKTRESQFIPSIETVLEFLVKTLRTIRPEGFNSETSSVGKEIVHLIKVLLDEFSFERVILKIEALPELIACLTPASARKCCLVQILPKLSNFIGEEAEEVMRLFGCLSKTDLVQLSDNIYDIETLKLVTSDLSEFSEALLARINKDNSDIRAVFDALNSPSSCLNLFILPKLLSMSAYDESFYKELTGSMLQNTSTVLPQRLEESTDELGWIEPEFTKLMAVKMNLEVIDRMTEQSLDPYEFYTEILNILNNNVSQDYLKIQIIQTVLDSFTSTKYLLTCDDFKCLLDHLCKESCQLLRKSDRCALLLKIIQLDEQSNSKYLDQITNLISQLPSNDDAIKFDYGCRVMEIVLKKSDNDERMTGQEETLYKWMKGYVERNPAREMEFYSIKLAMESNESDEIVNEDITPDTGNNNNFLAVDEDLQKLKIFESFQM